MFGQVFRRVNSLQEFRIDFPGKDDGLVYSVNLIQKGNDITDFLMFSLSTILIFYFTQNKLESKIL